jgi:hypothetical protein
VALTVNFFAPAGTPSVTLLAAVVAQVPLPVLLLLLADTTPTLIEVPREAAMHKITITQYSCKCMFLLISRGKNKQNCCVTIKFTPATLILKSLLDFGVLFFDKSRRHYRTKGTPHSHNTTKVSSRKKGRKIVT